MAQSNELMKGFQIGYQNAPFASLGQAIKSTIGRLQQREDTTSNLVTQEGIGQMFQKPQAYKPTTREEALDFERAKAGIVGPADELEREKTGLEISKLKQEQDVKSQKLQRETDLIRSTAQENLDTVRAIKEGSGYFGAMADLPTIATPGGMPGIFNPEAEGYRKRTKWESNINKLLSQKVVDLITTMKSASQTGATGFGQLSEKEGQLLRDASTALNKNLAPSDAVYYLEKMEELYTKILSGGAEDTSGSESTNTNPFVQGGGSQSEITVISPDGQEGTIPFEDLDEAEAAGYRRK